jgi:hypothetical protein
MPGSLNENAENAVQRIQHDLDAALGRGVMTLTLSEGDRVPNKPPIFELRSRDRVVGRFSPLAGNLPDVIQILADEVQHDVIDELYSAWPVCPRPGHRHPLTADVVGDVACWKCPNDHEVVADIGAIN